MTEQDLHIALIAKRISALLLGLVGIAMAIFNGSVLGFIMGAAGHTPTPQDAVDTWMFGIMCVGLAFAVLSLIIFIHTVRPPTDAE